MDERDLKVNEVSWSDARDLTAGFADSPQYTPFAGYEWFGYLAEQVPGRVYILAAESGGRAAGYLPVWEARHRFIGKAAEIPPVTPYWGPVIHPGEYSSEKSSAKVNRVCSALAGAVADRYRLVRMSVHPTVLDVRPFTWTGWSASPRYTRIISFDDADVYLSSLSGKVRNKIKQCEVVEFVSSRDAGPFVAMYAETFRRVKMEPPIDPAGIVALTGVFGTAANFYYAHSEKGEPVAGRFVVRGRGIAYDLLAAATEAGRGPVGAYLLWRELCDLAAAGLKVDMVGVNVPSIARFKESFGGELTTYYIATWAASYIVKALAFLGRRAY